MSITRLAALAVVLVYVVQVSHSVILPAGKCRTDGITVKPIDYRTEAKMIQWTVRMVPNVEPFTSFDHYTMNLTYNDDWTSKEEDTITFQNGSTATRVTKQTYVHNFVTEDSVDDKGHFHHFHIYPLAVLEDHSIVYYRCSEIGGLPVDTRFIGIPKDLTLSEASVKRLKAVDSTYNFQGDFYSLPYQHYNAA